MLWSTPWGPFDWAYDLAKSPVFTPQQDGLLMMPPPSETPPPDTPPSSRELPTSLIPAVQRKTIVDRAELFLSGDYRNLLRSMNTIERW